MPATALRCRRCETEHALEAVGVCSRCWGPLDPVYDWDELARTVSRSTIAAGPWNIWRYHALLPVERPESLRIAPGMTPLVEVPRLAAAVGVGQLYLKLDTANPTHSFKDRVAAVAAAKAVELGMTTLACSSTGNLAGAVAARAAAEGLEAAVFCPAGLEVEKLVSAAVYGATIYAVRGTYDHTARLTVELALELPSWGFVNSGLRAYYAEGSKTVGFEIAEQLGWDVPDVIVGPIASGTLFTKTYEGLEQLGRIGLIGDERPRMIGGQAEGCSPVASAFHEERAVKPVRPDSLAKSLAIGDPADGDLAVATARSTGGTIQAVPEDEIGPNMALLAETTGVFGETAAGVTLGALKEAIAAGRVGPDDRVVLLVTGDGLKTPGPVAGRLRPIAIEADADALLEQLQAA